MDFFEKNKIAFERRFGDFPFTFEDTVSNDDRYVIEDCKNGCRTLKIQRDGKYLYLHSKYDPAAEAEKWASSLDIQFDRIVVLVGMGLGYHVHALLNRMTPENQLYIYEPEEDIFNCLLHNIDISSFILDSRVKLFIGQDVRAFNRWLKNNLGLYDSYKVKLEYLGIYKKIFIEKCREITKVVGSGLKDQLLQTGTVLVHSKIWFDNCIQNMKFMGTSYSANGFLNAFAGMPIIIVSAGPSLNRNIKLLKEIKGKACIIAVYTALKALDLNNIKPDLVLAIDYRQNPYPKFDNIAFDMPLVCSPVTSPRFLDTHTGKKIMTFLINDYFLNAMLTEMGKPQIVMDVGGSVACLALEFAYQSAGGPIIFIGQDFAYTDKKSHAEGTHRALRNKNSMDDVTEHEKFLVEDIHGGQVYTDVILNNYRLWFEDYILEHPGRTYINATEGGALIRGAAVMSLKEAADTYCTQYTGVENVISRILETSYLLDEIETQSFIKKLKTIRKEFDESLVLLQDAIDQSVYLQELYQANNAPENKDVLRILDRFREVERHLDAISTHTEILVVILQETIMEMNEKKAGNISEGLYVAEKSFTMYSGLKDKIEYTIPLLDQVIKSMENAEGGAL